MEAAWVACVAAERDMTPRQSIAAEVDVPSLAGEMMNRRRVQTIAALVAGAALACILEPATLAQQQQQAAAPGDDPLAVFRAPLLREGSHLVEVEARLRRDPESQKWMLLIQSSDQHRGGVQPIGGPEAASRHLIVLPCTALAEMERMVESAPRDSQMRFRVTGQVSAYRGRNYVMPRHAPALVDHASDKSNAATQPATRPGSAGDSAAPDAAAGATTAPRSESTQQIIEDLERSTGPVMRSSRGRGDGTNGASGEHSDAAPASNQPLLREDTKIVNRRGKLVRDSAGGWTLVFDADAAGLADPPMKLLPCLLLERIEDYAKKQGNNSPALISGTVSTYHGRNYLLPTVFRVPQDRKNITP
jgi:hypothetical protein